MQKIKKDDEVIVLTGRDRGKRGKVLRALPQEDRVIVEGVNMMKRHTKPSQADPQGGIKEKEAAIHVSNVALIDPKSNRPTRVGFKVLADGRKVRVAKRSGEVLDV
ncbi:MAG: 50S ribosomal protein L24 [Alphaproteobacteria bacterium]|nr:50S ribosomal protein L24 [Alphaproteobacteria bacterium]